MQRGLGGTVFEAVQQPRDKELTLGPAMLTLLGLGLFALCALCFVFGYTVGHRNAESGSSSVLSSSASPASAQAANSQTKPSAGQGNSQPQAAPLADQSDTSAAEPSSATAADSQTPATGPASSSASEPLVRTAITGQAPSAQPVSSGGSVQSALSQSSGIVVQIAAVSHPEDADVLVGALRKRGYAVTARRDPADGLLHVQIGPFASRNEALAMRQKLLNDGYNAIVQP